MRFESGHEGVWLGPWRSPNSRAVLAISLPRWSR